MAMACQIRKLPDNEHWVLSMCLKYFLLPIRSTMVLWTVLFISTGHTVDPLATTQILREDLYKNGLAKCQILDGRKYVTGLLFNGPGMHTYFERSYCFRELAIRERWMPLCHLVEERQSWLFDGSQVSRKSCQRTVSEAIAADKQKAQILLARRDTIIESVELIGIIEYDRVTAARSLILRGRFKPLDWPYYRYDVEFLNERGEVLASFIESPTSRVDEDRVFIFRLQTLRNKLSAHGTEEIASIAIRISLTVNADNIHITQYVNTDHLGYVEIANSGFGDILFLGTISHGQWLTLLEKKSESTAEFFQYMQGVLVN